MMIAKATHERGRFSDKPREGQVSEESRPEICDTLPDQGFLWWLGEGSNRPREALGI